MSKGSNEKKELDKQTNTLIVDRVLSRSIPSNYGFIKNTLAEDGDPLDIFVLGPVLSGLSELEVIPIGVFFCSDQGIQDHKILSVPLGYKEDNLNNAIKEIKDYLSSYKAGFYVLGYSDNPINVLHVYRKTKLVRVKQRYTHEKLSPWGLLGIFALGGLLVVLDWALRKLL